MKVKKTIPDLRDCLGTGRVIFGSVYHVYPFPVLLKKLIECPTFYLFIKNLITKILSKYTTLFPPSFFYKVCECKFRKINNNI